MRLQTEQLFYFQVFAPCRVHQHYGVQGARERRGCIRARFFRAGHSVIVGLSEIIAIRQAEADEHVIVLRGGARVRSTRGLRELQDRLLC